MTRVLIVGGGGREHAIAHALSRSPSSPELVCAPGNPGIASLASCLPIAATDIDGLVRAALERSCDLVVVGPEAPLALGLADRLRAEGVAVFGPSQTAARLEASKAFAKEVMASAGVPTSKGASFTDPSSAIAFSAKLGGKVAVKADGLAQGKGVIVSDDEETAKRAIEELLGGSMGEAGRRVVIEEKLEGEELSVLAVCDGERCVVLPPAQDHKRVGEGDTGPNTGGMGAYSPPPAASDRVIEEVENRCLRPVLALMRDRGTPFVGVLYAGIMLTADGPKVLEYNARFGDPEAQVILTRLDEDLYALLLAAAKGTLVERPLRMKSEAAVTIVLASEGYPAAPRTGDPIEGLDRLPEGVIAFHAGTKWDASGRLVTSGGRVLSITALGSTISTAKQRAVEGAKAIRFAGMHFRSDIGWRALAPGG
jgi:phosphoribosylamine---glycine ligase